ncbi:MAG: hypothetical protein KAU07_02105 [Candidatus Andersenbacteria bacterium]|nr:hypothetical protein [Candidatus Andersenbacteria bacterium]
MIIIESIVIENKKRFNAAVIVSLISSPVKLEIIKEIIMLSTPEMAKQICHIFTSSGTIVNISTIGTNTITLVIVYNLKELLFFISSPPYRKVYIKFKKCQSSYEINKRN